VICFDWNLVFFYFSSLYRFQLFFLSVEQRTAYVTRTELHFCMHSDFHFFYSVFNLSDTKVKAQSGLPDARRRSRRHVRTTDYGLRNMDYGIWTLGSGVGSVESGLLSRPRWRRRKHLLQVKSNWRQRQWVDGLLACWVVGLLGC